jgi:glycosyltransferase involved in cell wall biosynthesis
MHDRQRRDTCIFTIVSNNYLHFANTLFESLREHAPQCDLVLGLCDERAAETRCPAADGIVTIDELEIARAGVFVYQYSILELNTAIKPYLIEKLMGLGYRKIIYFDPDIRVYQPLDEMLELLDRHSIVLTPHLTDLLDDGRTPSELQILQAGSYNLGYIGLRVCDETRKLVRWWKQKLYKDCVVDLPRNLFVDQKWMDLVPSMFDGVHINRDPGWNVAYWNLNHRSLHADAVGTIRVNGRRLTFFHFSGYSRGAATLSKHQDRFDKGSKGSPLRELCASYEEALVRNGIERFENLPYAFGRFVDGTPVPASARRLIRTSPRFDDIDLLDPAQCGRIHAEFNRPVTGGRGVVPLTALAMALWECRSDLRDAFPGVAGIDSRRYAEWLLASAGREAGFSEVHLAPIRLALAKAHSEAEEDAPSAKTPSRIVSALFRFVWRQRDRIPLKLRLALGESIAAWAFQRAYPRVSQRARVDLELPSSRAPGVNLIGYLHAESGVGEAARASLRALRCTELPYSLVDYRLGNISRMGEVIEGHVDLARYPVNLMHVNADQSRIAREHLGPELFEGRYTIGYWYWEMPEFPDFLHFAYEQVDEIWVSTEYNRQSIARHTDKPVRVIPPAIEVSIEKPLAREDLHMPADDFIFLHMSDVLSIPQRKNPLGVVEAFIRAFGDDPDAKVKLVVKLSNLDHQPDLSHEIFGIMESEPRIQLIHEYLDRNTLNNLLDACDCFVSLHRAEGFGLPIAEAMYLGKAVIATHWSGNADMMDERNSLPVAFRLVPLLEDIGPYRKGQVWAEPDIGDAARKMATIAERDSTLASELGARARHTMRERHSPAVVAAMMEARIREILELENRGAAMQTVYS